MTNTYASRMRHGLLAAAVAQALIAVPVMAQTAPDTREQTGKSEADTDKAVALKEVTVTAQRREQSIQKVPVSVTAIDEVQLERRGISNLSDLSGAAPGLVIRPQPGTASAVAVEIRGKLRSNPAMYWDTPVGMYVDGVYIGKTGGNVFNLLNLQRIEVLRGPQGTLFGRNTMAGAVNLITNPPSGEFTGQAQLGLGNYGSKVGRVMMDLPAMGKFRASVGARVERRDGWIKTTPGSSEPELGNRHNDSAYVGLEYDVTDNLMLNYRFDYSKTDQSGLLNQAIISDVEKNFRIPGIIVHPDRQTTASIDSPNFERAEIKGHALTATWKLGDAGSLKYIGAYRELENDFALDLDGSPIAFAKSLSESTYDQTSHELQYLGSIGRWNWVAGLYSFEDDGFTNNPQSYFMGMVNYNQNNSYGTRSRAAYGQVDYQVTDKLTLTAGWRRTLEDKRGGRFQELLGPPVRVIIPKGTAARTSSAATTPMLAATYQLTPTNMVYMRYAEGFMGGGFNGDAQTLVSAITPFKPEFQKTYEVGTKNMFLENRLSVSAGFFFNHVTDLQGQVFNATGAAGSVVVNVGHVDKRGVELETQLRATENLTMMLNYGYLDGGGSPRDTVNFVLDHTLARTSKGILHTTLDYRFVAQHTGITDSVHIRAYSNVNAQLAFGNMDWGNGLQGEVALWAKNLTNTSHIGTIVDFGAGFGNLQVANFNEPRTFGVNFTARW